MLGPAEDDAKSPDAKPPAANSPDNSPCYEDAEDGRGSTERDADAATAIKEVGTDNGRCSRVDNSQCPKISNGKAPTASSETLQAVEDQSSAEAAEGIAQVLLQEPARAVSPRAARAVPAGPMIWLVSSGGFKDIIPIVSLALTLQAAGYRVKAFIPGMMVYVAKSFDIPHFAADVPILFSMAQTQEALRKKLAEVAVEGEEGLADEPIEEIFLYLSLQKIEALHWREMTAWKDAHNNDASESQDADHEAMTDIPTFEKHFAEIWSEETIDLDAWWDAFRLLVDESMARSAQRADMQLQEYLKVRAQKRKGFLADLKKRAYEACVTPLDFLVSMHGNVREFMKNLMNSCMDDGKPSYAEVTRNFEDFFSWQKNRSIERWWEVWLQRLPNHCLNQEDIMSSNVTGRAKTFKANLAHEARVSAPVDKPSLLMYRVLCATVAEDLSGKFGIKTVPFFLECSPTDPITSLIAYKAISLAEEAMGSELQPITKGGPAVLSEKMARFRHPIIALSPLQFREISADRQFWEDEEWREKYQRFYTGFWFVDMQRQLQASDPRIFGGPTVCKQLEAFMTKNGHGELPVCIAWVSKTDSKGPARMATNFVAALRSAKRRGIVVSRWTRLTPEVLQRLPKEDAKYADENVFFMRAAPFEWLFPRCCCIVTPGGHGTMGAIMRSGTPAVVITDDPSTVDRQVVSFTELGTAHLHQQSWDHVTPKALSNSINMVVGSLKHQNAAKAVKEKIAADRGAEAAVEMVAQILESRDADWLDDFIAEAGQVDYLQDAESTEPRYPWPDGEYDCIDTMGQVKDRIRIQGDRGEFRDAPGPIWFKVGNFTDIYNQSSKEEYTVQCYLKGINWANVSNDGCTWQFSDGNKFVYRMGFSKNCECIVS